jgi:hypothetical protein
LIAATAVPPHERGRWLQRISSASPHAPGALSPSTSPLCATLMMHAHAVDRAKVATAVALKAATKVTDAYSLID